MPDKAFRLTICALQVVTPVLLSLAVVGCQRNPTVFHLDNCLTNAVQLAKLQMSTTETDCDFGKEVWVVGIPSGKPTANSLQALGVPEFVSLSLSHNEYASPQWCVVVEDKPSETPAPISQEERRQFEFSCTVEDQEMQEIEVIRASQIRLKVTPQSDGKPQQLEVSKVR